MEKFVVCYMVEGSPRMEIMSGSALAKLYGFSDCYALSYVRVWKSILGGELISCKIYDAPKAPFNRLVVEAGAEVYWYEWDEH